MDTAAFYQSVVGRNCENVVGFVPLPVGVVGPLMLDGEKYTVPLATTSMTIKTESSDGWCVDGATYGSVTVELCGGVWLDKPCDTAMYGSKPCLNEFSFDPTTGVSSFCAPPPPPPVSPPYSDCQFVFSEVRGGASLKDLLAAPRSLCKEVPLDMKVLSGSWLPEWRVVRAGCSRPHAPLATPCFLLPAYRFLLT